MNNVYKTASWLSNTFNEFEKENLFMEVPTNLKQYIVPFLDEANSKSLEEYLISDLYTPRVTFVHENNKVNLDVGENLG